eukprot:7935602-Pyramimonas_sp.AAC.1
MSDDTGDTSTGELISLLRDCVAEVADHSLVGCMFPAQNAATEVSALSSVRAVDCFKGDGVWAALDEGCNSCCHGKARALNAGDQFEKWGFYPKW